MHSATSVDGGCGCDMKLIGAILVATAALVGLLPSAHADDDEFISLLAANGIPAISGLADLKKTAHQVCDELNSGVPGDVVIGEWEVFANSVTPGLDPGRVHRTAVRFISAAAAAYCPNHQIGYRGHRHIVLTGATEDNGSMPLPQVPDAAHLIVPQAPAPVPPPKKALPSVGPPTGPGGGSEGSGGGAGGSCPNGCGGPGMVALAP